MHASESSDPEQRASSGRSVLFMFIVKDDGGGAMLLNGADWRH